MVKSEVKPQIVWILSFLLTGADYVIAVLTGDMVYLTNDDGFIQGALSGAWTGTPYPLPQFINILIGYPIAGLYRIFPSIQWWYVCSQILVAVGIFLVHFFLLKISCKNKLPLPFVIAVLLFFDIGFFILPIANISFTIVPAILGTGMVAGLFWLGEKDDVKFKKLMFAGIIVGYVILFSWRKASGQAVLCYLLLGFLFYFVSHSENWKRTTLKFLCTAGIFLAITAALSATNKTVQNNRNGEDFVTFNSARAQFIDYIFYDDTYDANPMLYEEVGWDRDTYKLAERWCFINEEVNTETLSYISEHMEYTREDMMELLERIYYDDSCQAILLLYAASFIMAGFVALVFRKKKTIIFWLLNNIGTVGLFCYQIFGGRANYRSLMVFFLPAVTINLILSFRQVMEKKAIRISFMILTLFFGVICLRPVFQATFNKEHAKSIANTTTKYDIICEYISDHPYNFYVTNGGTTDYIAPIDPAIKTLNLIKWGAPFYYSDLYYEQLHANGLSELTEATFKKDNVYFISSTNALSESYIDNGEDLFAMFERTLKKDCDAAGFVLDDTITNGAYVYHFVFEENMDEYDSYYDIVNGHTVQISP